MMTKRNRISVTLQPHIKEALEVQADQYGVPLSTLAAIVLAQWLEDNEAFMSRKLLDDKQTELD